MYAGWILYAGFCMQDFVCIIVFHSLLSNDTATMANERTFLFSYFTPGVVFQLTDDQDLKLIFQINWQSKYNVVE
jgi:hypothetical protein